MSLVYNIILGRLFMYQINVIISIRYLTLEFLTKKRVAMVRRNQVNLRQCIFTCLKEGKKKAQYWTNKGHWKKEWRLKLKLLKNQGMSFLRENELATIKMDSTLTPTQYQSLIQLFHIQRSNFAIGTSNMPRINPEIIIYQLKIDSTVHLICLKKKNFKGER